MEESIAGGRHRRAIATWLFVGVAMIMVQVLLGGITRLTGSGLSITEWKPILGALPPMNEADWQVAFDKYRQIGQFKHLNFDYTLSDFKFIYFWEWFHRQWARFIGVVFLVPFIYFILRRMIARELVIPMAVLFLLGALQGAIGWIMVKSGLNEEKLYVSHLRLAVHFLAAMGLLCYTLWFALRLHYGDERVEAPSTLRRMLMGILALLTVQLAYGAFMAGLKAGSFAPTWPDINGSLWPTGMGALEAGSSATDDPLTVQFIHRGLAYLLAVLIVVWALRARGIPAAGTFSRYRMLPPALVCVQVVLGIWTVLQSADARLLLWLGTAHQFVAMLLLMSLVWLAYLLRPAGPVRY